MSFFFASDPDVSIPMDDSFMSLSSSLSVPYCSSSCSSSMSSCPSSSFGSCPSPSPSSSSCFSSSFSVPSSCASPSCVEAPAFVPRGKRKRAMALLEIRKVLKCLTCSLIQVGGYQFEDYVSCNLCGSCDFAVVREWSPTSIVDHRLLSNDANDEASIGATNNSSNSSNSSSSNSRNNEEHEDTGSHPWPHGANSNGGNY
eukprot:GHVT01089273.1.p1 GENE.GHVT01089273.1~~GHVT01089273.1.p1  ORF type:complete len:200 (-),score=48.99 GHVT01089273.1:822-1421(-)